MPESINDKHWDEHWLSLERKASLFKWASSATRRLILQPAVMHYAERFFSSEGVFVEMGCGTGESSAKVSSEGRMLIGLDYSTAALLAAARVGCFGALTQANVFSLPYRASSIDGIWNLGVMEHFSETQLNDCLAEFHRVLKPGGIVILFWPPVGNASRWVLGPLERIMSWILRKSFRFFPDEISLLRSADQARSLLLANRFDIITIDFSWRTAFIHKVVVGRCL